MKLKKSHREFIKKVAIGVAASFALILVVTALSGKSESEIRSNVVKLEGNNGLCSGEQVNAPSGQSYILTAGHCAGLADQSGSIQVTSEDGKVLMRKVIAEDANSDLLLLEGLPGRSGLDIAKFSFRFQEIRTFTHGARFDTYRTKGTLIQEKRIQILNSIIDSPEAEAKCSSMPKFKVIAFEFFGLSEKFCILDLVEAATDALIVPGSSGGAVVDARGHLLGVVSAGGGGFGYLVTLKDIKAFLNNY